MLPLKDFATLVSDMAAAVQGAASQLIDLTVGSVLRAVLEANASVALWMQWLILRVLQTTRAATSVGPDLDSWMADFGLTRLAGVAAGGTVSFARWTPGVSAQIPAGALIKTADGSQSFAVVTDATNAAWLSSSGAYQLAAGVDNISLPIVAVSAGVAGNVQAGAISLLATAIPGVDTVTNSAPCAGGVDPESDAALRTRFSLFLDSRNRATAIAITNAIVSTQQGLVYAISENVDPSGAARPGFFTVTLDNGTGSPPSSLLSTVAAAIEAVRPLGSQFAVVAPQVTQAQITLTLTLAAGAPVTVVQQAVVVAITAYVDALPIGSPLPLVRLAQVALDADPTVINVGNLTINGVAADLVVSTTGLVRAGTVTVN